MHALHWSITYVVLAIDELWDYKYAQSSERCIYDASADIVTE